jgi:hypothetical protein
LVTNHGKIGLTLVDQYSEINRMNKLARAGLDEEGKKTNHRYRNSREFPRSTNATRKGRTDREVVDIPDFSDSELIRPRDEMKGQRPSTSQNNGPTVRHNLLSRTHISSASHLTPHENLYQDYSNRSNQTYRAMTLTASNRPKTQGVSNRTLIPKK